MDNNQTIQGVLAEITAESLKEYEQPALKDIKTVANRFLRKYDEAYKKWEIYQGEVTKYSFLKTKIQKTYAYMKQSTDFTRQILTAMHNFETDLNNLFHRTTYLTYVEKNGNFRFYGTAQVGQMYKEIVTKGEGGGKISQGNILKVEETQLEDKLKNALKQSIANKKEVYRIALERYEKNEDPEYMHYNPSEKTFWWRTETYPFINWTSKSIGKRGWIAQGYVEAVMKEDPEINNSNIESSLARLWNYIVLDSKPSAIQQDLVFGRVEFAVKSGNFSTPKVAQYIKLAKGITYLENEIIDLNYFKEIVKNIIYKKNIDKKIIQSAENQAIKEFKKLKLTN